jgi:flagellar hook-associated protein 3 FlgL
MSRIATSTINQRGIDGILQNQVELSKVQKQMSSGKRVVTPADDPVAATQMLNLEKNIRITEQYQANADYARNRLSTAEQSLSSVGNLLQRVQELAVSANKDSLNNADRRAIAAEVDSRLEELVGLANGKDGAGEYLFAGSKGSTRPFSYTDATGYQYNGDQRERDIRIGPDFDVQQTNSGDEVFMRIQDGNGTFTTDYNPNNNGTGQIDRGRVTDAAALTGHDYTVEVIAPPIPPLPPDAPNQVQVRDNDTGNLVVGAAGPPPTGTPYQDGMEITFDGITVGLEGEPDVGDEFTVEASRSQSVFETVKRLSDALKDNWNGNNRRAQASMEMEKALQDLSNAQDSILEVRAGIGARLNSIDSQNTVNGAYNLQMEETLSGIQDLDYAKASGELNLRMVGLQAAQQVYSKVKGLSLFNYVQ